TRILAAARPRGQGGGLGREVTLRRAIEAALPVVDQSFANQPLIEAQVRMTLGQSFGYLAKQQIAVDQYQRARELYTQQLGPDHPDTLRSMASLVNTYNVLGRFADAVQLSEEVVERSKVRLGPQHLDTLVGMNNLANSYWLMGRYDDALKLRQ